MKLTNPIPLQTVNWLRKYVVCHMMSYDTGHMMSYDRDFDNDIL